MNNIFESQFHTYYSHTPHHHHQYHHNTPQGPLNRTLALFDDWLAFVRGEVLAGDDGSDSDDMRRRLAWLGTHPRPVAGFHRHHPDHAMSLRSLARDDALNEYVKHRMEETGIRFLDVFDMVSPFRDCTADGTHHAEALADTVAGHRVLPWVCDVAVGEGL